MPLNDEIKCNEKNFHFHYQVIAFKVKVSVIIGLISPQSHIFAEKIQKLFSVGLSKGVGFIRFDQRVEAERAIQKLNGTIPDGATEPITVKFANSPSSNKNGAALTPLTLAPYLPQTRRFLGPIHHPSSRIRFIMLYTFLYQFNSSSFISCT